MRWLMEKAGGYSLTASTLYGHHPIDEHYPYAKMQKASAFLAIYPVWRLQLARDHEQQLTGRVFCLPWTNQSHHRFYVAPSACCKPDKVLS